MLVKGSAGYQEDPQTYCQNYESVSFEKVHKYLAKYYPTAPAAVLDIGAGSGRDAAALARQGYFVDAVEPTESMLAAAQQLHTEQIQWIHDGLPELRITQALGKRYDLILLIGVFFHLAPDERQLALANCADLLLPGGLISMSLRHGPIPPDRHMFDIPDEELLGYARQLGLEQVHYQVHDADTLGRDSVHWSSFIFAKAR